MNTVSVCGGPSVSHAVETVPVAAAECLVMWTAGFIVRLSVDGHWTGLAWAILGRASLKILVQLSTCVHFCWACPAFTRLVDWACVHLRGGTILGVKSAAWSGGGGAHLPAHLVFSPVGAWQRFMGFVLPGGHGVERLSPRSWLFAFRLL